MTNIPPKVCFLSYRYLHPSLSCKLCVSCKY
jgi:hypothetical protein